MKNKIAYIIIASLVLLQVYSLMRIQDLEKKDENINNTILAVNDTLYEEIESIYNNVDEMLEEEASLIHEAYASFTNSDLDELKVAITFYVQPKQVSNNTIVSLQFDDEVIVLNKDDTAYSATKVFDLSSTIINPNIIIDTDGVKTITNDDGLYVGDLFDVIFIKLYPQTVGGPSFSRSYGSSVTKYEGYNEFYLEGSVDRFQTIKFVTYIDDEIVNEETIKDSVVDLESEIVLLTSETYTLNDGEVFATYMVALDSNGFTHLYPIEYYVSGDEDVITSEYFIGSLRLIAPDNETTFDITSDDMFVETFGFDIVYPKN